MTRDTIDLLLANLAPPRGRAWHGGPTPVGAVRGVTAREARTVPRGSRHSIWSLTLHLAYWKYAVRRHFEPVEPGSFPRSPANFPRVPARPDEAAWKADRALLATEHRRLAAAIAAFDPARLGERSDSARRWTYGELIVGSLLHDAWHAGQVQLLKRMVRPGGR